MTPAWSFSHSVCHTSRSRNHLEVPVFPTINPQGTVPLSYICSVPPGFRFAEFPWIFVWVHIGREILRKGGKEMITDLHLPRKWLWTPVLQGKIFNSELTWPCPTDPKTSGSWKEKRQGSPQLSLCARVKLTLWDTNLLVGTHVAWRCWSQQMCLVWIFLSLPPAPHQRLSSPLCTCGWETG